MIYGYLRVSTDEQDYNSQKQGVDNFAQVNGWTIDKYITDEGVSGGKDPHKRRLGSLIDGLQKGDKLIASEISRLGRDLLMVMDILKQCMDIGAVVYTVKDNFVLGDDVQSKVLAFAFGLSAEIERKMIQMRTMEGLKLRMKKGVLLGRPPKKNVTEVNFVSIKPEDEEKIIYQYDIGVPLTRIATNFGICRATVSYFLARKNKLPDSEKIVKRVERDMEKKKQTSREEYFSDHPLEIVSFDKVRVKNLIECGLTIPEIHKELKEYTYKQVYDSIYNDYELNLLYRAHGQKRVSK